MLIAILAKRIHRLGQQPSPLPGRMKVRSFAPQIDLCYTLLESLRCTVGSMGVYRFTEYFENEVLRKRPYLRKEWCIRVLENPIRVEPQEGNRFRFWGEVDELEGRILRVITLSDQTTIHNAFPDRRFKR